MWSWTTAFSARRDTPAAEPSLAIESLPGSERKNIDQSTGLSVAVASKLNQVENQIWTDRRGSSPISISEDRRTIQIDLTGTSSAQLALAFNPFRDLYKTATKEGVRVCAEKMPEEIDASLRLSGNLHSLLFSNYPAIASRTEQRIKQPA